MDCGSYVYETERVLGGTYRQDKITDYKYCSWNKKFKTLKSKKLSKEIENICEDKGGDLENQFRLLEVLERRKWRRKNMWKRISQG